MNEYIIYESGNGQIRKLVKCRDSVAILNTEPTQSLLASGWVAYDTYYIDIGGPTITLRPSQTATQDTDTIVADGVAKSTISGIVVNSEVFIDNVSQGINPDTTLELTFDTVGVYNIKLELFPYLDQEFIVNAN